MPLRILRFWVKESYLRELLGALQDAGQLRQEELVQLAPVALHRVVPLVEALLQVQVDRAQRRFHLLHHRDLVLLDLHETAVQLPEAARRAPDLFVQRDHQERYLFYVFS